MQAAQRREKLVYDERGAIMLVALFFAIFALAAAYFAVGVSQAAVFRSRIQDGADGAALAGAVMQARCMNLLVLLNLLMAALLSILVALKLVETIAIVGMLICAAVAYPTMGASLTVVTPLENLRQRMNNLHEQLEDPIGEAIEAIKEVADLVQDVAPAASLGVAKSNATAPVVDIVVHIQQDLPVEDDKYKRLCSEAAVIPVELAMLPLKELLPDFLEAPVTTPLTSALGGLASVFSWWFCGDDLSMPPFKKQQEVWYPKDPISEECGGTANKLNDGAWGELLSQDTLDCGKQVADAQAAQPEEETGACTYRCGVDGPYEQKAQMARTICNPAHERFEKYSYQIREGSVQYTWDGLRWVRGEPVYEPPVLVKEKKGIPCGTAHAAISPDYATRVRESDDVDELIPVCSDENFQPPARTKRPQVVTFLEVSHIFACGRKEEIEVDVAGVLGDFEGGSGESSDSSSGSESGDSSNGSESNESSGGSRSENSGEGSDDDDSSDRSPKRVIEDLVLGDEEFQIRAIALGRLQVGPARRLVEGALWGHPTPKQALGGLGELGEFGVAQAEYFFDGDAPREDWMWAMKWKARLVRWRADEDQLEVFYDLCDTATRQVQSLLGMDDALKSCGPLLKKFEKNGAAVTH